MNQQEKLARQWAERIKSVPRKYHDEMHHAVADFILAHTTPELAELVAGLRYEYAVQLKHGDGWIMSRHRSATHEDAKAIQARYSLAETRIVRRLVTDEEVVE